MARVRYDEKKIARVRAGVYFIRVRRDNGPLKIGYTKGLRNRLSEFRSSNPDEIELLGFWEGATPYDERELHDRYAAFRIRGEWYRDCSEIREEAAKHPDVEVGSRAAYNTPKQTPGRRKRLVEVCIGDCSRVYRPEDGWLPYMVEPEFSVFVRDNVPLEERPRIVLEEVRLMGRNLMVA